MYEKNHIARERERDMRSYVAGNSNWRVKMLLRATDPVPISLSR